MEGPKFPAAHSTIVLPGKKDLLADASHEGRTPVRDGCKSPVRTCRAAVRLCRCGLPCRADVFAAKAPDTNRSSRRSAALLSQSTQADRLLQACVGFELAASLVGIAVASAFHRIRTGFATGSVAQARSACVLGLERFRSRRHVLRKWRFPMRNAKWISPVIVGLGLALCFKRPLPACRNCCPALASPSRPASRCRRSNRFHRPANRCSLTSRRSKPAPVQKVELLPPVCQPVQPYVPPVKACEQVQAPKACEPVKGCDGSHELVVDRLLNKVDRAIHATAYKIHAWKQGGYVEYSAPPQDAPLAPAPASAPANVPTAPVPARSSNS